jgi:hypothetical protein
MWLQKLNGRGPAEESLEPGRKKQDSVELCSILATPLCRAEATLGLWVVVYGKREVPTSGNHNQGYYSIWSQSSCLVEKLIIQLSYGCIFVFSRCCFVFKFFLCFRYF